MSQSLLEKDAELVCWLTQSKIKENTRTIIGIAGPPASGKSTLAQAVVGRFNQSKHTDIPTAALLPMDGYHLDNRLLESQNLLARKGALDTFDAHGFCDAVKQLSSANKKMYYPKFDREMDLSIANAIAIHHQTNIIVVEGNYLLMKSEPWACLRDVFAVTVFVSPEMSVLNDRLTQRWMHYGFDAITASKRAINNDLPNAQLVLEHSVEADITLTQNYS